MVDVTAFRFNGIGLLKDGELVAIVQLNGGDPKFYSPVTSMDNTAAEILFEINKVQSSPK